MLNNASYRENDRVDFFFYFFIFCGLKRSVSDSYTSRKITMKKAQAIVVKCTKYKSWVPRKPPLVTSVLNSLCNIDFKTYYHVGLHIYHRNYFHNRKEKHNNYAY